MKSNPFSHGWFLLSAALLILAAGCATQERSYNDDYNHQLQVAPKYVVDNQNDSRFKITVHQGSPGQGTQRAIYMKQAAATIAETEAHKRGWQSWAVDYIQERDNGWMHILVA